jgi:peptidoglycan/xylan/chitin deacetylase (PgdA/CDA1 family)
MRSLLFVLTTLACVASSLRAEPAPPPANIVPIVFKLDDVRTNDSGYLSERWRRLLPLVQERKIKLSLGVIADSLENAKPAYISWLKEMHATGLVEFWFHGYDHGVRQVGDQEAAEFTALTYEEQKARFDKSQKLAQEKLGFTFQTYGPPGGGKMKISDADLDATARVLTDDPSMKVWLYPSPIDARGEKLNATGKVTVLDRVWAVNLEQPLFVPNPEKFIAGYNKYAAGRRYFILQGHANKWDEPRWAEFLKIVDYVTQNKIPTMLPTELAASLSHTTPDSKK